MNLPFFAVKAYVSGGGGVQNQAEKNSKNAFRPVPVQKFTFPVSTTCAQRITDRRWPVTLSFRYLVSLLFFQVISSTKKEFKQGDPRKQGKGDQGWLRKSQSQSQKALNSRPTKVLDKNNQKTKTRNSTLSWKLANLADAPEQF